MKKMSMKKSSSLDFTISQEINNLTDYLQITHLEKSSPTRRLQTKPLENVEQLFEWAPQVLSWKVIPLSNHSDICYEPIIDSCHSFIIPPKFERKSVPKTIFCHDLKGGYLEDRFVQGSEKHDEYRFFHWGGIDTFIYFSHKFITIPPVGWINAAHRHGVKVLGTIITEWDEGVDIWNDLCEKEWYTIVDKLVLICSYYKFDGYLINIENKIDQDKISYIVQFLQGLTERLKLKIPHSQVIWYDSITKDGKLKWQNALNEENKIFFDACDGIFLNYNWTEENLKESKMMAYDRYLDVYVGIDVFGRGCFGGGGFNSSAAFEVIRRHKLSAALFAPSWTHECHSKSGHFESLEYLFWKGIWPYLYIHGPSDLPFTTTFCQVYRILYSPEVWMKFVSKDSQSSLGFGQGIYKKGKIKARRTWYNLSLQQYQNNCVSCISLAKENSSSSCKYIQGCLQNCSQFGFLGGSCLQILSPYRSPDKTCKDNILHTIFLSSFPVPSDKRLSFSIVVKNESEENYLDLIVHIEDGYGNITQHILTIFKELDISKEEEKNKPFKICYHFPKINKHEANGWNLRIFKLNPLTPEGAKIVLIGCQHSKNLNRPLYLGLLNIQAESNI